MVNIATTATVIDHSSDAAFRTWVAEIITTLSTTLTLTQTSDTGQINTATVTRPASTNQSAGYAIFRFSDTLQSTSPIFIRIDFGNANSTTQPQFWVTLSNATDGAGTLNGSVKTLTQACLYPTAPSSTVTSYTSRYCVNMSLGYVGLAWKFGGNGGTTYFWGGFQIYRSNDSSGNPTGDAVMLIANSSPSTATFPTSMPSGTTSYMGYMQCMSFLTNQVFPTSSPSNGNMWTYGTNAMPLGESSTASGSNFTALPVIYRTPQYAYSAFNFYGLLAEFPLGSTVSLAMIGSTPLTFISLGQPWGSSYLGQQSSSISTFAMLWQ
jgi:hypothetical protein